VTHTAGEDVVARAVAQARGDTPAPVARSARFAALEMPPLPAAGGPLYEETAAFMAANDPSLQA
jgi:hypothetical protein